MVLIKHAKRCCKWESFKGWNKKNLTYTYYVISTKIVKINFPGATKQSIWIISGVRTFGTSNKSCWHFYQTKLSPFKKSVLQRMKVLFFVRKRALLHIFLLQILDPKLTKNLKLWGCPEGRITMTVLCLRRYSSSFRNFPKKYSKFYQRKVYFTYVKSSFLTLRTHN